MALTANGTGRGVARPVGRIRRRNPCAGTHQHANGMRQNLAALPTPPVPRAFAALQTLPEGLLVAVLRRFLRSTTAVHSGLSDVSPATAAELGRLAEQMRAHAKFR